MLVNVKYKFKPFQRPYVKEIKQNKKRLIMKKLSVIVILIASITFTAEAQHRPMKRKPNFTTEQKVALAVKKMTLSLDLTARQQKEVRPFLAAQIRKRETAIKQRIEARKTRKKPSKDELFAMQNKRLDDQINFKNRMKIILDKKQFEKFEKIAHARKKELKGHLKERIQNGRKYRMIQRWSDEKK